MNSSALLSVPLQPTLEPPPELGTEGCLIRMYPHGGPGGLWPLPDEETILGRSAECGVELEDDAVSRRHARLRKTPAGWELTDLQSTNGLAVNDLPVDQCLLQPLDRIRLGTHVLRYLAPDSFQQQYRETLYTMLTCDGLTGLANRLHLMDGLQREILTARRRGCCLSLVMADVDHFHMFVEEYGSLLADEVLREFTLRAQSAIEPHFLCGRYDDDAFCLVLPELDCDAALAVAEQLRHRIAAERFTIEPHELHVTTSIGVVTMLPTSDTTGSQLLRDAQQLLDEARQAGGNRTLGGEYEANDP